MKFTSLIIVFLTFAALVGCSASSGEVTARDVLKRNSDADIFMFNDIIYANMTDVEWMQENFQRYSKGEEVGEIRSQSTRAFMFSNFTATKLPKGTKIYSTVDKNTTGFLMVEYDGEIFYYGALIEG